MSLIGSLLSTKVARPPHVIIKPLPLSSIDSKESQSIAFEVYERLVRSIRPIMLRGMPMEPLASHAQFPAFTLAPPVQPPKLCLAWPLKSYDVLNRWRTIHCSFAFDENLRRAVAFVMDREGEAWKSKVLSFDPANISSLILHLFQFFLEFAQASAVDFRLVICFPVPLYKQCADCKSASAQLMQWLTSACKSIHASSPFPLSIIVAEKPQISRSSHRKGPAVPVPPSIYADTSTRAIDESLAATTTVLPRTPVAIQNNHYDDDNQEAIREVYSLSSFVVSMPTSTLSGWTRATYHVLHHTSPPDIEEDVAEVFAGEMHRLSCLSRMRLGLDGPLHLAAAQQGAAALGLVKVV